MIHIFIVNPYAGRKTFADDLRCKLAGIEGLRYFVFNTRYAGDEREIIHKIQSIFDKEQLRFYCCGGSGTMRNMMNGFEDLRNVEIAFFPCGMTNDFLKVFGENQERFSDIKELIDGDVIEVDYVRTNHGIYLNSLAAGMNMQFLKYLEKYRILNIFGDNVPYILGILRVIVSSKLQNYEICLQDKEIQVAASEIIFANGCVFGGSLYFEENKSISDGIGSYRIVSGIKGIHLLKLVVKMTRRDIQKVKEGMMCGDIDKICIRRTDGKPFSVDMDGEAVHGVTKLTAQMIKKGMRLVVPKGVRL